MCVLERNQCGFNAQHDAGWRYPTVELLDRRPFFASEDIYCILDMDEGYLSFATNNKYLGVAFRGLKGKTLYPIVSCVWGQCEITMKYLGVCEPEPPSLMEACRNSILERLEKRKRTC
uniref:SPRY domain-containing protein n=1 Tax=Panagrolaimus superbus TaxID=310955 RepID=A0A914XTB3_9BILA